MNQSFHTEKDDAHAISRLRDEIRRSIASPDCLSDSSWREDLLKRLMSLSMDFHPRLWEEMSRCHVLTERNHRVCVLLASGFSNQETRRLLSLSPQSLSNMKRHINTVVFGDRRATSLRRNLLAISDGDQLSRFN